MAQIINLSSRRARVSDNLISSGPVEFRRADWESTHFIQMLRPDSLQFERQRKQRSDSRENGPLQVPPYLPLEHGQASTIRAMFVYRDLEDKMQETYLLAGLMDCMINQVSPVLRTVLLRDMYKKILLMKKNLGITWHGPLDSVLLPIHSRLFDMQRYQAVLGAAETMKQLYEHIKSGTREMFDVISLSYVFYLPYVHP